MARLFSQAFSSSRIAAFRSNHLQGTIAGSSSSFSMKESVFSGPTTPSQAFRKWIKGTGDFVMVFVLVTDPVSVRAITAVIRRSGYILIPLSLLFIKYYPELGRAYNAWSGIPYYSGVTLDKNMFGYLLFAYGLFYVAELLQAFGQKSPELPLNAYRQTLQRRVAVHGHLDDPDRRQQDLPAVPHRRSYVTPRPTVSHG